MSNTVYKISRLSGRPTVYVKQVIVYLRGFDDMTRYHRIVQSSLYDDALPLHTPTHRPMPSRRRHRNQPTNHKATPPTPPTQPTEQSAAAAAARAIPPSSYDAARTHTWRIQSVSSPIRSAASSKYVPSSPLQGKNIISGVPSPLKNLPFLE